jgi:signal peptidase II
VTRSRATVAAALVAAGTLALDQLTKAIVRSQIGRAERVHVLPGVDLVNTRNSGVAFSLFTGGGWVLAVIALIALAGLIAFFLTHLERRLIWLPTGMLIGGAAGNLVDRAAEGSVTDFIDLPLWPVFNVADMGVTIGMLILLYVLEGPPSRDRRG